MSKYQTLDSEQSALDERDDGDVYEEERFPLYFDDNYKHTSSYNKENSRNNNSVNIYNDNNSNIILTIRNNNNNTDNNGLHVAAINHFQNYNNNSSNNSNLTHDFEEHTMEVPLLRSSSINNLNEFEQTTTKHYKDNEHRCCIQPGFGSNLICKSAQEAKSKMLLAILLCCIFMIIEFLGGFIAGSLAIMTDAAHLASDCISFVIGLVAIWIGSRPPDGRMSFGYKRLEVLGALASILGIWLLTGTLFIVAVERIYSNEFDLDAHTMMIVSGIGILINIAMIFILHGSWLMQFSVVLGQGHGHSHAPDHGHSHTHEATSVMPTTTIIMPNANSHASQNGAKPLQQQQEQTIQLPLNGLQNHSKACTERNLNLRAAMIHVIGDLVQSIGVFLAAILIKFVPSAKYADPLCTLLFSVIVILTTVQLFKESMGIILDAVPRGISLTELELDLTGIDGVKSVHHLNVWCHTPNHNILMAHLVTDLLTDSNTVLNKAMKIATSNKYNIKHVTIQIERVDT